MNLRDAAERIRILHVNLRLSDDLTALEKLAETCCSIYLTLVCTYLVNLWIERLDTSVICLERHSSDLVCPVRKSFSLDERPHSVCTHKLCSVEECETFLRLELDRLPSHLCPYLCRCTDLTLVVNLSESDEREAEVCKRSEVAGCAERTLLIHYRKDIVVEHIHQTLYCNELYSGITVRERLNLEKEHQLHNLRPYSLAGAAGVRHNEIVLKL